VVRPVRVKDEGATAKLREVTVEDLVGGVYVTDGERVLRVVMGLDPTRSGHPREVYLQDVIPIEDPDAADQWVFPGSWWTIQEATGLLFVRGPERTNKREPT
jgi:hypothetical protein